MNRRLPSLLNIVLLLALVGLSGVLAYTAINKRIYYVGTNGPGSAVPGRVPDAALQNFALRYVATFETFTPSTLAESDRTLQRFIHPRHYSKVAEMLQGRSVLVAKGKITSLFVPSEASVSVNPQQDGKYIIDLQGTRKVYLSDKLNQEQRVRYRITIQAATPTFANPYGLFVVGHQTRDAREANSE